MQVAIVFDDAGKLLGMSHPKPGKKPGSLILGRFLPHQGQHTATVEVPKELRHLKPRALHDAVRVEHRRGAPHLVALTK
jgi:hypothetical protein